MKPARIEHYKKLGWEFTEVEEVDYHNGDIDTEYYIKSPRLKEGFRVRYKYVCNEQGCKSILPWDWMTEKQILRAETEAYIRQRLEDYFNKNAAYEALTKAMLKNPEGKKFTITVSIA